MTSLLKVLSLDTAISSLICYNGNSQTQVNQINRQELCGTLARGDLLKSFHEPSFRVTASLNFYPIFAKVIWACAKAEIIYFSRHMIDLFALVQQGDVCFHSDSTHIYAVSPPWALLGCLSAVSVDLLCVSTPFWSLAGNGRRC